MRSGLEEVLERYGQAARVETAAGTADIRAFIQPMSSRTERAVDGMTALGHTDGRLWRYLGLTPLERGDTVAWNGLRLGVRSCRAVYGGQAVHHHRAVLELAKEKKQCGS